MNIWRPAEDIIINSVQVDFLGRWIDQGNSDHRIITGRNPPEKPVNRIIALIDVDAKFCRKLGIFGPPPSEITLPCIRVFLSGGYGGRCPQALDHIRP